MVLDVHSDASYLSEPKSRISVGGNYYLSSISEYPYKKPKNPMNNGPLHTKFRVLCNVVESAAEVELGVIFYNEQSTITICTTLK